MKRLWDMFKVSTPVQAAVLAWRGRCAAGAGDVGTQSQPPSRYSVGAVALLPPVNTPKASARNKGRVRCSKSQTLARRAFQRTWEGHMWGRLRDAGVVILNFVLKTGGQGLDRQPKANSLGQDAGSIRSACEKAGRRPLQ